MTERKKLSIVIPVYNEYHTIEHVVERALCTPLPEGVDRELIVVDDGSVDGTEAVLSRLAGDAVHHYIRLETNRGKGAAIRAGIPYATGDWVLIQDGDLEYDPSCYQALIEPLQRNEAQVVYGSRFLGTIEKMGILYRVVNQLLVWWTNLLFGTSITDEATAYKAFQTDLLRGLDLTCQRFEFCPEVTGKLSRNGIAIHEVPVRYLGRTRTQGKKIRWWDAVVAFYVLLRERLRRRR